MSVFNMFQKISIVLVALISLCLFACRSVQKSVDADRIYYGNVDEYPLFGGKPAEEGFCEYVFNNTLYPAKPFENCITGYVFVEFIVERDGSVSIVKAFGVDPILEAEVSRVVKVSPNWTPGKIDGKAVRVSYTLPVNFKLGCENGKSSSRKAKPSKKTILLKEVEVIGFGAMEIRKMS